MKPRSHCTPGPTVPGCWLLPHLLNFRCKCKCVYWNMHILGTVDYWVLIHPAESWHLQKMEKSNMDANMVVLIEGDHLTIRGMVNKRQSIWWKIKQVIPLPTKWHALVFIGGKLPTIGLLNRNGRVEAQKWRCGIVVWTRVHLLRKWTGLWWNQSFRVNTRGTENSCV